MGHPGIGLFGVFFIFWHLVIILNLIFYFGDFRWVGGGGVKIVKYLLFRNVIGFPSVVWYQGLEVLRRDKCCLDISSCVAHINPLIYYFVVENFI